jgi:hypothetical protein
VNVFFTVDTEFWPRSVWQPDFSELESDIQRDIYGVTRDGEFGLRYQLDVLSAEGLRGVFFIEAISALRSGINTLRDMIELVQSRGHDVELHVHSEWLEWLEPSFLPGRKALHMRELSLVDQALLIAKAVSLFKEAGLKTPARAFRAGNYGANLDTLQALAQNGIIFDSSYNYPYIGSACDVTTSEPLMQSQWINGVFEVPVNFYQDYPGHYRHTQLTATSLKEMCKALESAHQRGWKSFVIVSHSSELIRRNIEGFNAARADRVVIDRFEKLMRYLGRNKDRYVVSGFQGVEPSSLELESGSNFSMPLKGSVVQTALRMAEQGFRRFSYR